LALPQGRRALDLGLVLRPAAGGLGEAAVLKLARKGAKGVFLLG